MRLMMFIGDAFIIFGVVGILYVIYQQGKVDAKDEIKRNIKKLRGGEKKNGRKSR